MARDLMRRGRGPAAALLALAALGCARPYTRPEPVPQTTRLTVDGYDVTVRGPEGEGLAEAWSRLPPDPAAGDAEMARLRAAEIAAIEQATGCRVTGSRFLEAPAATGPATLYARLAC